MFPTVVWRPRCAFEWVSEAMAVFKESFKVLDKTMNLAPDGVWPDSQRIQRLGTVCEHSRRPRTCPRCFESLKFKALSPSQ